MNNSPKLGGFVSTVRWFPQHKRVAESRRYRTTTCGGGVADEPHAGQCGEKIAGENGVRRAKCPSGRTPRVDVTPFGRIAYRLTRRRRPERKVAERVWRKLRAVYARKLPLTFGRLVVTGGDVSNFQFSRRFSAAEVVVRSGVAVYYETDGHRTRTRTGRTNAISG